MVQFFPVNANQLISWINVTEVKRPGKRDEKLEKFKKQYCYFSQIEFSSTYLLYSIRPGHPRLYHARVASNRPFENSPYFVILIESDRPLSPTFERHFQYHFD